MRYALDSTMPSIVTVMPEDADINHVFPLGLINSIRPPNPLPYTCEALDWSGGTI